MKKNFMQKLIAGGIASVLMICMLVMAIPVTAMAQTSSIEKADVTISSNEDYYNFIMNLRDGKDYTGKLVRLKKDLDFTEVPVNLYGNAVLAYNDSNFAGTFDGGCHTIKGIKNYGWGRAFFGNIKDSGVVKNLYIDDFFYEYYESKNGKFDKGAIIALENHGTIENVRVTNSSVNKTKIGCFVSRNYGDIRNCTIESTSIGLYNSPNAKVGLFCDYNYKNGRIINCSFVGNTTDGRHPGGVFGYKNEGSIIHCLSILVSEEKMIYGITKISSGTVRDCFYADNYTCNGYGYGSSTGSWTNSFRYSMSSMKDESFVNKLNENLSGGLKWKTTDFYYPTLVDVNEVAFESTNAKMGYVKTDKDYAAEGDKVTITPVIKKGYKLKSLAIKTEYGEKVTAKKGKNGVRTFTMPDDKVVVTATIVKKK